MPRPEATRWPRRKRTLLLNGVEGCGRSSEDRRDAEGGSEDVEKSTDKSAERRKHAFRTASGKAAR